MNQKRTVCRKLDALMRKHKLSSPKIGAIINRDAATVRKYRCGLRPIPSEVLRLLELELSHDSK